LVANTVKLGRAFARHVGRSQGVISADNLAPPPNRIYIVMEIEFDPHKDATNIAKHGISLERAADMEMLAAERDTRFDYGEQRFRVWGKIDGTFYCLALTTRGGKIRPISLRRAHSKEIKLHVPRQIP